ncbi:MAG: ROK family protein [Bacteroidetes bacterium]|nr:ROK family protein [Bacteroidota bacterium]
MMLRFGMDFGGTNLKAGLFDENGHATAFKTTPLQQLVASGPLLTALLDLAREIMCGHRVVAGGLAIKGLVDLESGTVREDIGAGSLLASVPLRDFFSASLGIPFAVDNDARAYAWGEWLFGAGRGSRTMACMTLGTGIGCAVVSHGVPYTGTDQYGGLLGGHLSIDRNGPICPCGQRGCLELYCSATALRQRVREAHPELQHHPGDVLEQFFLGVRDGLARYGETCDAMVEDLATGIVNIIHAYAPDVVVLGGGVMKSADVLLPPLTALVHQRAWTFPRGMVKIVPASLGDTAAATGMAFHHRLEHI